MNKIRKVLSFILTLAMAFGMIPLWTGTVHATPATDPTKWEAHADIGWYVNDSDGIYTINSDTELAGLAVLVNAGTEGEVYYNESGGQYTVTDSGIETTTGSSFYGVSIELGADIDLSEYDWVPIGKSNYHRFSGTFDGKNHTVSGLKIGTAENPENYDYAGLFGDAETDDQHIGITLKNLKISGAVIYIDEAYSYAGAVAGLIRAEEVTNCSATGTITSSNPDSYQVGGFAGVIYGNPSGNGVVYNVTDCHADCNVVSSGSGICTGGFAGSGYNLKNCFAEGDVIGSGTEGYTGGFVGYGGELEGCHATGDVTGCDSGSGTTRNGGLAGEGGGNITNCYAAGNVTCGAVSSSSDYGYAGGLIGYFSGGTISNCHAAGTINCIDNDATGSKAFAGGLIGGTYYGEAGNIINSYSTGDVNAGRYDNAGGFAGECGMSVLNCLQQGTLKPAPNLMWEGLSVMPTATVTLPISATLFILKIVIRRDPPQAEAIQKSAVSPVIWAHITAV